MPNAYYTCNLLPLERIARTGYSPRWLGAHLQDPGTPMRRDALSIHPMTCPFVTGLVAAAEGALDDPHTGTAANDVIIVPAGCDAMRRLGDLLSATYPGRVFVLSMPREAGDAAAREVATDLERLEDWLRDKTDRRGQADSEESAGGEAGLVTEPPHVDYPALPEPGGVFVVAGPLTDNSLLRLVQRLGARVSRLESCTSPERWKPLAAADPSNSLETGVASDAEAGGYLEEARRILSVGICPRRSTAERRSYLAYRLDEARPSSVIYARQSFCDPGAYDAVLVAQLARDRGLPYLEIEVGFPFDAGGPLRTRVEAFLEAQLLDDDLLNDLLDEDLLDDFLGNHGPAEIDELEGED